MASSPPPPGGAGGRLALPEGPRGLLGSRRQRGVSWHLPPHQGNWARVPASSAPEASSSSLPLGTKPRSYRCFVPSGPPQPRQPPAQPQTRSLSADPGGRAPVALDVPVSPPLAGSSLELRARSGRQVTEHPTRTSTLAWARMGLEAPGCAPPAPSPPWDVDDACASCRGSRAWLSTAQEAADENKLRFSWQT